MATFNKTKVNVAVSNHSKLDVSSTHITSNGFMHLQPCYYRHMIPGEHIKGSGSVLTRLAPVAVPTYGRCRVNQRAFFVPFRTIFPNFNDFIVDTIASNYSNSSLVSGSPIIDNGVIRTLLLDSKCSSIISGWNTGDPYDFIYSANHYKLTYTGRRYLKILESLGYRPIWTFKGSSVVYSALGLLAMAKIWCDWYMNNQYKTSAEYLALQRLFKYNDPAGQLSLTATDLDNILVTADRVGYDAGNNVYLNAWDNPMAPNSGNGSVNFAGDDITMVSPLGIQSGQVIQDSNGTPFMIQNDTDTPYLGSAFLHTFLKSMTDYVKRNQLSGAAAVDRLLARFGINVDSAAVDRSIYVNEASADVDFGSVMQTVNTETNPNNPSNLGDYAGQGFGKGNLGFDFKTDEFGIFMVLYTIVPVASLYQGFDRNNLHVDKLSFFTPEYDNLGCQAISKGEVYVSKSDGFASNTSDYLGVFGFAPRYYEYKQKTDYVTGDITSPCAMRGGDAWHLNREFDDASFPLGITDVVHSFGFTYGIDAGSFDRIFQYTGEDLDKFYLVFKFAAESLAPCKSAFDTYDFDDAGQKLSMDSNGVKVN